MNITSSIGNASQPAQPTILFHAPNQIGLGHINRLSAVALSLRNTDRAIRSVFVVEGSGHVLLDVLGLPYLPLPSGRSMYRAAEWAAWPEEERARILMAFSQVVVRNLRPTLVVFDCFPSVAMVNAVVRQNIPIVLCLREMRDLPAYLRHISHFISHTTLILIPHEPGAFEVPESIRSKSQFIGQIARSFCRSNETRNDSRTLTVVITGGGGGFNGTSTFYNLAMQAILILRQRFPLVEGRLITGPLFHDFPKLQVVEGVTIHPFEPDIMNAFCNADVVLSTAGYNTAAELEQVGARAVFVPAETKWDDQLARAERLARAYAHFRCFRGTTAVELALAVEELLRETPFGTGALSDGADKAASILRSLTNQLHQHSG
jgi:predicted glycosyltransferase